MKIYVDGAGWNGYASAYAVVGEAGNVIKYEVFYQPHTNNEMEYTATLIAARLAPADSVILSDSQLVVFQVLGEYSIKEEKFLPAAEEIRRLMEEKNLTLKWIPRGQNLAGHFLEKTKNQRKRPEKLFKGNGHERIYVNKK